MLSEVLVVVSDAIPGVPFARTPPLTVRSPYMLVLDSRAIVIVVRRIRVLYELDLCLSVLLVGSAVDR